ncbi:PEP-CTERM sorting domain-containing protein [Bradyrhizobium sp. INPA01-394B]|uniref:PEP-CTERM sorting domain-containing protein n=1 Tax=Bradyrhizobium campsiandrae TaxID=1729892 RepID=A0ABR7U7U9_9BRAD|nr:PEP-CTERM sorting domain-containing protein [Bradyrhizobium campsiandrae]MBC9876369.1 PEP-CTERM sorting domain-containing protein [Bradyrhizobium campsiandrae]MBC9980108.1 PEP-CTERM sorting domain-containing protein [Bradyrhizobium campsiandrae]
MKIVTAIASTFIALTSFTAGASASVALSEYIPFYVDIKIPGATATGFFSAFTNSNYNSDVGAPFRFVLTEGAYSATLIGSSTGNNAYVAVGNPSGHTISVTNTQVFFDFSSPEADALKFYTGAGDTLCFQTASAGLCGAGGAGITILVAGAPDPFLPMSGNQPIASAVPEPSTWAMMLLGFCGLGWLSVRRKARPALATA